MHTSFPVTIGFVIDAVQTGVHFCRFNRAVFNVSNLSIDEWYADTVHSLGISEAYWDSQYYPANFTSCGNYGGCKFREVCAESPDHRATLLKEDFEIALHEDLVREAEVIHAENLFGKFNMCLAAHKYAYT